MTVAHNVPSSQRNPNPLPDFHLGDRTNHRAIFLPGHGIAPDEHFQGTHGIQFGGGGNIFLLSGRKALILGRNQPVFQK